MALMLKREISGKPVLEYINICKSLNHSLNVIWHNYFRCTVFSKGKAQKRLYLILPLCRFYNQDLRNVLEFKQIRVDEAGIYECLQEASNISKKFDLLVNGRWLYCFFIRIKAQKAFFKVFS